MELPSIEAVKAIAGDVRRETAEYETRGTVTKISGSQVFVRFEGSDIDTPVDVSCAGVSVGDTVSVHVSHDDTHIIGNRTDPSATSTQLQDVNSRVSVIDSLVNVVASTIEVINSGISVINSRIRVRDNVLEFLDELGGIVAAFGERIRLGNADAAHVDLDDDSLDFSVGGSTVASYGIGSVELGNDSTTADILLAGKKSKIKGIDNDSRVGFNAYTMSGASEAYPNQQASLQLQVPKASGQRGWAILQYSDTSNASNPYNSGVSASSNGVYLYGKDGVYVSSNWSSPSANANRERVLTVSEFTETVTTVVNETVASGGAASGNKAAVKPSNGTWYPICVSGWYAGSRYELLSRARLSGKANNACTINYAVQNTSNASRTCSMDIHILWARVY